MHAHTFTRIHAFTHTHSHTHTHAFSHTHRVKRPDSLCLKCYFSHVNQDDVRKEKRRLT